MEAQRIARLLPNVYQRTLPADLNDPTSPLAALLTLMTSMHKQPEAALRNLDHYFDLYRAPEAWVYYLASWLDLEPLFADSSLATEYIFATGTGRLRELVLAALSLTNERGTYRGLRRFLQIAIGYDEFQVIEDPEQSFHIQVHYPAVAAAYLPLIRRIVELEKPAYVTYDLYEHDQSNA